MIRANVCFPHGETFLFSLQKAQDAQVRCRKGRRAVRWPLGLFRMKVRLEVLVSTPPSPLWLSNGVLYFFFQARGGYGMPGVSLMQPPCLCKGWGWRYCHLRDPLRSRNKHCVPSIHSPTRFHQRLPLTTLANIHFKTAPATFVCHPAASSITPNCICVAIIFYYVVMPFSV